MTEERPVRSSGGGTHATSTVDPDPGAFWNPVATCLVAALLLVVFAIQWWVGAAQEGKGGYAVYLLGGLYPPLVWEGEVFRIVTAPLLHLHVHHFIFNLSGFLGLGAVFEGQAGHARFLLVVGISMIAGSLAALAFPPSGGVLVGASGGLFGMLGALAVLVFRQRHALPPLLRRVRWVVPVAIVLDSLWGLFLSPDRIGWVAHLGGFVGGMAAMAVLARGAGPIPLESPPRRMRVVVAVLCALFLLGAAVDVERVVTGRICRVMESDDLSAAMREGFEEALRRLPVSCAEPVNEAG